MGDATNRRNSIPQTTTMSSVAMNATRANGGLFISMLWQVSRYSRAIDAVRINWSKGGVAAIGRKQLSVSSVERPSEYD